MAIHPADPQVLVRQYKESAAVHILQDRLEQALADYRKAVELAPRDTTARLRLAELLSQLGREHEAVREYQHLAVHHAAQGRLIQAIACCRHILQLEPSHQATQETLANLCAMQSAEQRQGPAPEALPPEQQPEPAAPPPPTESTPGESSPPPTPLFSQLPRELFVALLGRLEIRRVHGGEHIITEGERGTSMFILVEGAVRVVRLPESGAAHTLAELEEGSFFGEMGLISDAPRVASVVATRDCVLLEVTREMLADLSSQYPALEQVVQQFYKERLLDNLLHSSPLFQPLSSQQKRAIAERFRSRAVEPGTVLLQQGQRSNALPLLLRGRCAVVHEDPEGGERPYPDMTEGAIFGEISLLLDSRVTATVRAVTPCLLLLLDQPAFEELVLPHPEVRRTLTR
ncbi:MAG TPA: cyclic nucleotide-binding domain-containing protein, partial [Myxococcaceae bacterium]|nr:cyclic nucleotide-binding domain-containing protein [Myxococcaceae bacterium]